MASGKAKADDGQPPADWSGFYAGGHAGLGTANFDGVFDSDEIFLPFVLESSVLGRYFDVDGVVGGVHAGYNWQSGNVVYGLEADWTRFGHSDRQYDPEDEGPGGLFTDNATAELNWLASLRGRIGYASNRSLIYATAGIAWADARYAAQDRDNPNPDPEQSTSFSGAGYVLGGGLEHMLAPNLWLRLEGLYYGFDLSHDTSTLTADSDPGDFVELSDVLVGRIGLTWRFGAPAQPGYEEVASSHAPGRPWTGFYVGGHAGYGVIDFGSVFDSSEIDNPFDLEDSVLGDSFDLDGPLAGVQAGYDYRIGDMVVGAEIDWTWLGRSDNLDDPFGDFIGNDNAAVDIGWLASLRGRLGYLSHDTLLYATAGIAWAGWSYDLINGDSSFGFLDSGGFSRTATGAVFGGGMEHALSDNVMFRVEALYYGFDDRVDTPSLTSDSDPGDYAELGGVTVVRAGLSFKLPVR